MTRLALRDALVWHVPSHSLLQLRALSRSFRSLCDARLPPTDIAHMLRAIHAWKHWRQMRQQRRHNNSWQRRVRDPDSRVLW